MTSSLFFIRASSLPDWGDCPRRWAARNVRLLIAGNGFKLRQVGKHIGAFVGTGAHAAAEFTLSNKMKGVECRSMNDAFEVGIEAFRDSFEQNANPIWDAVTNDKNVAEHQIKQISSTYSYQVAPTLNPIALEIEMKAVFSPSITLTGHADVVEVQGIRDLKTGKSAGKNCVQLGAYSLLARSSGFDVGHPAEDHIPRTPKGTPVGEWHRYTYKQNVAEKAAHYTLSRIQSALAEFTENGEPQIFQSNPSSMLCSDIYCPAHSTSFCREHKGSML